MPVQLFTEAERARRNCFPEMIGYEDLGGFFTLSERDLDSIPRFSAAHNRLGYALQLCALRFMGFVPDDFTSVPPAAVAFLARQLGVDPDVWAAYGARAHTRQDHLHAAPVHLGYRKVGREDFKALADWLLERALEHDKPTLLYEISCEKLRAEQFIRPGVTRLERLVAEARQRAQAETFRRLGPLLRDDCTRFLDTLLASDPDRDMTPLAWIRRPAASNSPRANLEHLDKLAFLRTAGVEHWDLEGLNSNRLKLLAQLARKSSAQALQRAPAERRYPILVAFLYQSLIDVTDEVIEMVDRCLADADARAEQDLQEFRTAVARATNEKVYLFCELGRAVLDPTIADADLRTTIYQRIPPLILRRAVEESDRIVRPLDESYVDFLETRYSYLGPKSVSRSTRLPMGPPAWKSGVGNWSSSSRAWNGCSRAPAQAKCAWRTAPWWCPHWKRKNSLQVLSASRRISPPACHWSTSLRCSSRSTNGQVSVTTYATSMDRNPAGGTSSRSCMPRSWRKAVISGSPVWRRWPISLSTVWPGVPPGTCVRTHSKPPPIPWSTVIISCR